MRYYSTNKKSPEVDFTEALMRGLAPDGGLYMPKTIPDINISANMSRSFHNIALAIAKHFIDIPQNDLKKIINDAFSFKIQLKKLDEKLYVLELFHGPTLSFKDFGARFLARMMSYFAGRNHKTKNKKIKIITATSGDTGSAVASAFHNLPSIKVLVLYPKDRISAIQEKQIATLGGNVTALKVAGDFDDCQKLAKQALADAKLRQKVFLSSANSINIGRLIPQSFYYAWASLRLNRVYSAARPVFIIPSGNFGNLTGALIAKKMGFPIGGIFAAVNKNYGQAKAEQTISSAMDVAKPSNWARVKVMGADKEIKTIQISEEKTREAIRRTYKKYNYIADPHTAVGLSAAVQYCNHRKTAGRAKNNSAPVVVVSTAHPAKFKNIVEKEIGNEITTPLQLKEVMYKKNRSILLRNNYSDLRQIILS